MWPTTIIMIKWKLNDEKWWIMFLFQYRVIEIRYDLPKCGYVSDKIRSNNHVEDIGGWIFPY